jgi:hypothetical protein
VQYEKIREIAQAIHFFMKAGKSTYAAQMAMKYGVDKELLSLSLQVNLGKLSCMYSKDQLHF